PPQPWVLSAAPFAQPGTHSAAGRREWSTCGKPGHEPALTARSWIVDAADLYLFTGPRLTWPLQPSDLQDMARTPGLTAWVVFDNSTSSGIAGHFDLTLEDGSARLARVIIDPAMRGRGVSHTLVVVAEEKA